MTSDEPLRTYDAPEVQLQAAVEPDPAPSTSIAAAVSNLAGISADLDAKEAAARAEALRLTDLKARLDAAKEQLAGAVNAIMGIKKEMGL